MTESKLVFAIETSCDDTSVALVGRTGEVVACETVSQFELHSQYGGIFPEIASRAHLEAILPTVQKILGAIDHDLDRIEAIGVTRGPGLIGSLLVGVHTARGLGLCWNKPVLGINHLRGHMRSADLDQARVTYPTVLLLVSGGHTILAFLPSKDEVRLLGRTRDDSVGECYDKVARMLGFGMPGGPHIDRMAAQGTSVFAFPRPMIHEGYAFSFSGLKSSVARLMETSPDVSIADVAASFVAASTEVLVTKCRRALAEFKPASLTVVGGVSASPQLRAAVQDVCDHFKVALCLPPLRWSTDNAAMIGLATWDAIEAKRETSLEVDPNLRLEAF